ncbi:PASTA domain-containing protein [Streptomyces prasinosporus]|uniref:PASTA domain-containing protein n=1 Tax=Streptomyces prasinosporus TaxID=68256 RepID=A0ABP6TLH0_9ACTN
MRMTPGTPEVRVPRLVGLMAVDTRESARSRGPFPVAPDRPDFRLTVVDHVVRRYPRPGAEVPRDSPVHVWFDPGEGEGGGGVREPRGSVPPAGGLRREREEPCGPGTAILSRP